MRLYEFERKEQILKIIEENDFPLIWEDEIDGGVVKPHFDFTKLDEKVLALEPIPEADLVPVGGCTAKETPLASIEFNPLILDHMKKVRMDYLES